ncbi:PAS domain-containing protein [Clostridium sp. LBM24168]
MTDHKYKLFFKQLLKKSEDGFIVVDDKGIITDINEQYCNFLARKQEDVIGKPIGEVISTTSMYDVLNQCYQGDGSERVYMQPYSKGETRDENETYCVGNRFCIFDERDNVIGAMAQMKFRDRSLDIAHEVMLAEMDYYESKYHEYMDKSSGFDNIVGNDTKIIELKKKALR